MVERRSEEGQMLTKVSFWSDPKIVHERSSAYDKHAVKSKIE
jgi:hypothetical protein